MYKFVAHVVRFCFQFPSLNKSLYFVRVSYYCSWFRLIKFAQLVAPTFFPWRLMCDNQLKQPQNQKTHIVLIRKQLWSGWYMRTYFYSNPETNIRHTYICCNMHRLPWKQMLGHGSGSVSTGLYKYNCSVYVPKYNSGHDHRKKKQPQQKHMVVLPHVSFQKVCLSKYWENAISQSFAVYFRHLASILAWSASPIKDAHGPAPSLLWRPASHEFCLIALTLQHLSMLQTV